MKENKAKIKIQKDLNVKNTKISSLSIFSAQLRRLEERIMVLEKTRIK